MHKKLIVLFILLCILTGSGLIIAEKTTVTIPLEFSQIRQGQGLLRDKNDKVYSAVIMTCNGLEEFVKQYPIQLDVSADDFEDSFYIIGFSDNSWGIEVDGFKQLYSSSYPYYYLDVADAGEEIKTLPPPEGKKYSAYAIIKVSNKLKIAHVQVREGIPGGLSARFQ